MADDALAVVALAKEHHATSRYAHIPFEGERVWQWYNAILTLPAYGVFVYDCDTVVSGYLAVVVEPYIWAPCTIAREVALYVTPQARNLWAVKSMLNAAEDWCRKRDVHTLDVGMYSPTLDSDIRRYGKLYERLGFTFHGESYKKELHA